jgi:hypothetical protein
MKTKNLVTVFGVFLLAFSFSACNKNDTAGIPGTIQLNASTKSATVKSAAIQIASGTLALQTAAVEIQNLVIEENSGNDNQDEENYNDGTDNESANETEKTENDGGDVVLPGPYVLDIVNGAATIDQVSVQPGTYKKVDFDFVAGPENNGNSILITGEYTSSAGVTVPFELTSDLSATVQLPLTKNISVSSGSTVSVSIVFDIQSWLSGLDFENATVTGNKISINSQQNTGLYNSFVTAVNQHIEIED